MQADVIPRFHAALPRIRAWMDQLFASHTGHAKPIGVSSYPGLAACYPADLLERVRVVSVERTPYPPVAKLGLPEFTRFEGKSYDGITFQDYIFLVKGREAPQLLFHELVHVVQWARLGADKFLLAYASGLAQFGYEQSPLEHMAFSLQAEFARGSVAKQDDLMRLIEERTDAIWSRVEPQVGDTAKS